MNWISGCEFLCQVGEKIISLGPSWTLPPLFPPSLIVTHEKGVHWKGLRTSEQGVSYQFSWIMLAYFCSHGLFWVSDYLDFEKVKMQKICWHLCSFHCHLLPLRQCHRTKPWNGDRVVGSKLIPQINTSAT